MLAQIVMRIHRPYSLINSRITVTVGSEDPATSTETIPVVGEARQVWAPLKRKYDLFVRAREGDDPDAFQQVRRFALPAMVCRWS